MLTSNEFYYPDRLVITEPVDALEWTRSNFDYANPNGFALCNAEQVYYKSNNIHLDAGHENQIKYSADHLSVDLNNPNESSFTDRFHIGHSYTQYRYNFKGAAKQQISTYADQMNYHGARVLLQLRPKWGFKFQMYTKCNNVLFEFLNLEYEFSDAGLLTAAIDDLEEQLIGKNFNWFDKADEMYSKKEEWELLDLHKQRQWKSNFLLGWQKHYITVPCLIV
jgi:hypothetical protein